MKLSGAAIRIGMAGQEKSKSVPHSYCFSKAAIMVRVSGHISEH